MRTLLMLLWGLLFGAALLAAGCEETPPKPAGPPDEKITLGYVEWEESVAVSNLARVLLENAGYKDVELRRTEPEAAVRGVASGELDAFLGLWLPKHAAYVEKAGEEVALLNPWLVGTTRSSLAAPSYMEASTLEELEAAGAEKIVGVEPGGAPVELPARLPGYSLERDLYPDTSAMLEEVERLYEAREPFAFVAWSPHWMNTRYEFEYIEDPEGVLGELTQPARLQIAVRKDFSTEARAAYALLDSIVLAAYQVEDLQLAIQDAGTPAEGARNWAVSNGALARRWVEIARVRSGQTGAERAQLDNDRGVDG